MATVFSTSVFANGESDKDGWIVTWSAMKNGDVGSVPSVYQGLYAGYRDRTVQVEGTSGAGFGLAWEGSNDGINFHTLKDPFNSLLNLTSVGQINEILEAVVFYRPRVASGDGTTSVTVTAFFGKTRP